VFYSCGEQSSQAVQALEKEIKNVETQIQETNDCDDLQLITFSILGLRTDLEKLQQDETVKESEILELTNTIDQLDASLTGKYVALDCNQAIDDEIETFGEDEYEDYNIL
jgi:septation ring formation regulator EzrA